MFKIYMADTGILLPHFTETDQFDSIRFSGGFNASRGKAAF
jgi:hypothetical protein